MNNHHPITYSINSLPLIVQDIDKRSYFIRKTISLLDRKADMDVNYAFALQGIISKEYIKNTNDQTPSQILYKQLVSTLLEEAKRTKIFGQKVRKQVSRFQNLMEQQYPQAKKTMMVAQSISKEMTSMREKLQKSKTKFDKKNKDLEQAKIDYICSYLSNEQLQRKNQLYLQVNSLEESTKPLRQDYDNNSNKYNDLVAMGVQQFKNLLTRIQSVQVKKLSMMKQVIGNYLQIQKESLDEVLRRNPFLKADIDCVRERDQFVPHNDGLLDEERVKLMIPYVNEAEYIDCLYDRMEISKTLEQIILYGQARQHKKELNDLFVNGQESITLSPKTIRMVQIFRCIFEGEPKKFNMLDELDQLLQKDQKVRKNYILCLQKYRISNQFQLKLQNKDIILDSINRFLCICDQEHDTYNSKLLMVLSLTYHFEEDDRQVELQELISNHQIWKRSGWWQAALLESIFQETRVKVKREQLPITIWDIKAGGVSRKEESEEMTHQHICFNQLLYYIRNMSLFHLHPYSIIQYAKQNISLFKFTGKFAKDIIDLCPQHSSPSPLLCR